VLCSDGRALLKYRFLLKTLLARLPTGLNGLYKIEVPGYQSAQYQVKIHSEARAVGTISRDNFVSLTSMMASTVFITALADGYRIPASDFMQHVDYTELRSAIGLQILS
jgi:hypothetical protein